MRTRRTLAAGLLAIACAGARASSLAPAPEFPSADPQRWIGTPVTLASLRGQVVLLDVWTFECVNCLRTDPWIRDALARFGPRGLRLVGVHTPEFPRERVRDVIAARVRERRLDFPHYVDNDNAYWNALHNEYWPAHYLVDRCGRIRQISVGEVHLNEDSGRRLETGIEALLAEKPGDCS